MYGLDSESDPSIDWGKTAADYARHRPGPPSSYYARLTALNIGLPGQRLLDLGTGTGVVARQMAAQGCEVVASDIAAESVVVAAELAKADNLQIEFQVAAAEDTEVAPQSIDVVTANQCFLYFDVERVLTKLQQWLKPNGVLVISHFSWLPHVDAIAEASEGLILQHNPNWQGAGYNGQTQPRYPGLTKQMHYSGYFYYDEPVHFSRDSWLGRIRASRGIGATLSPDQVAAFNTEHQRLLEEIAEPEFTVTHRIDAHVLRMGRVETG
jgi:SAM-dependent methyltransferase